MNAKAAARIADLEAQILRLREVLYPAKLCAIEVGDLALAERIEKVMIQSDCSKHPAGRPGASWHE